MVHGEGDPLQCIMSLPHGYHPAHQSKQGLILVRLQLPTPLPVPGDRDPGIGVYYIREAQNPPANQELAGDRFLRDC